MGASYNMAQILPLSNDGCSKATATTAAGVFTFTTYYMPLIKSWLMDMADSQGSTIIYGLNLQAGVDNLLKGLGNKYADIALRVISIDGTENNTPQSLGTTNFVVLFAPSEPLPQI